jgi:tetratricopeptide (TPR) repeat protein
MSAEASYARAQELQAQGKHAEASAIYKELIQHSADPRFFIPFGICLQHLGHWQEFAKHLQHGIDLKLHCCEGDARLLLAESLLQLGHKRKAIEQCQLVAVIAPEYPSYEDVPEEAKGKLSEYGV